MTIWRKKRSIGTERPFDPQECSDPGPRFPATPIYPACAYHPRGARSGEAADPASRGQTCGREPGRVRHEPRPCGLSHSKLSRG